MATKAETDGETEGKNKRKLNASLRMVTEHSSNVLNLQAKFAALEKELQQYKKLFNSHKNEVLKELEKFADEFCDGDCPYQILNREQIDTAIESLRDYCCKEFKTSDARRKTVDHILSRIVQTCVSNKIIIDGAINPGNKDSELSEVLWFYSSNEHPRDTWDARCCEIVNGCLHISPLDSVTDKTQKSDSTPITLKLDDISYINDSKNDWGFVNSKKSVKTKKNMLHVSLRDNRLFTFACGTSKQREKWCDRLLGFPTDLPGKAKTVQCKRNSNQKGSEAYRYEHHHSAYMSSPKKPLRLSESQDSAKMLWSKSEGLKTVPENLLKNGKISFDENDKLKSVHGNVGNDAFLGPKSRYILLIVTFPMLCYVYWTQSTRQQKMESVIIAIGFAMIERLFTCVVIEDPETKAPINDFAGFSFSRGHTSIEQFVANILYGPLLLGMNAAIPYDIDYTIFGNLTKEIEGSSTFSWITVLPHFEFVVRSLFFPVTIWICELVQGTYLLEVWGKRAWHYQGPWAMAKGHITLSFGVYWILLGFAFNFFLLEFVVEKVSFQLIGGQG
eukprot:g4985.t1